NAAPLLLVHSGIGCEPRRLLLRGTLTLEPGWMHSRRREGNERRSGGGQRHHRSSHGRRAHDADWDNVVVRDEESRSGRVATHSAVCTSADAVAGVGAAVPAEEPGAVSTRTSDPAAQ